MRIEALESIKDGRYVVSAGDIITIDDDYGLRWCAAGWAKDPSGTVPTGERIVIGAHVVPNNGQHTASNTEV